VHRFPSTPIHNQLCQETCFVAKGHIAKFLSELFPDAALESFEGILTVEVSTPGGKIAGTALELGTEPGQFTTLPVMILE
jgi:hypothetical protein